MRIGSGYSVTLHPKSGPCAPNASSIIILLTLNFLSTKSVDCFKKINEVPEVIKTKKMNDINRYCNNNITGRKLALKIIQRC